MTTDEVILRRDKAAANGEPFAEPPPRLRGQSTYLANHKRVAEVWLDEYKQHVYRRNPRTYENLDAGDVTAQKALRARLKCKPFKWFMEVVAPDMLKKFPPIEPPDYASGALQSVAYPQYCLDTLNGGSNSAVGLYYCAANKTYPQPNQFWRLSYHRDMRAYDRLCLDVPFNKTVLMWHCHEKGGNQFWHYERQYKWLKFGEHSAPQCMEAIVEGGKKKLHVNPCDKTNKCMQWNFGYLNQAKLDNFSV